MKPRDCITLFVLRAAVLAVALHVGYQFMGGKASAASALLAWGVIAVGELAVWGMLLEAMCRPRALTACAPLRPAIPEYRVGSPIRMNHIPPLADSLSGFDAHGRGKGNRIRPSQRGFARCVGPWGAVLAALLLVPALTGCQSNQSAVATYTALERDVTLAAQGATLAIDLNVWKPSPAQAKQIETVLDRLDKGLDDARAKVTAGGDVFDAAVALVRAALADLSQFPAVSPGKGTTHAVDAIRSVGVDRSAGSGGSDRTPSGSGNYPD